MNRWKTIISLANFIIVQVILLSAAEYRNMDGSFNNRLYPDWGKSGVGINLPNISRAEGKSTRSNMSLEQNPNPRLLSSRLFSIYSKRVMDPFSNSDMLNTFAAFVFNDMVDIRFNASDYFPIPVPECDENMDKLCTGTKKIPFYRAQAEISDLGRHPINYATSFIDASNVYGSESSWATKLRTQLNGELKVSSGDGLPTGLTYEYLDIFQQGKQPTYFSGDYRATESLALTSFHTVFLREHNRLCQEIDKNRKGGIIDNENYEDSRRLMVAYIQSIADMEFIPSMLGESLPPYSGLTFRMDSNGGPNPYGAVTFIEGLFNSLQIQLGGIEGILRASAYNFQQKIDIQYIDELRNLVIGNNAYDVAAMDILKGRDYGTLLYNDAREYYGLSRRFTFSEITQDEEIITILKELYQSVDDVDFIVGGLAEDVKNPSVLGELFTIVLKDQLTRSRDGDRFWYENSFSGSQLTDIKNTRLRDIITRNTNIRATEIPPFLFAVSSVTTANYESQPNYFIDNRGITHILDYDFYGHFKSEYMGGRFLMTWRFIDKSFIEIKVEAKTTGWAAVGFNDGDGMFGSDMIIGWVGPNGKYIGDYYSRAYVEPRTDISLGGTDDIMAAIGKEENGWTTLQFVRKVQSSEAYDKVIIDGDIQLLIAMGDGDNVGLHNIQDREIININMFTGHLTHSSSKTVIYIHAILGGFAYALNSVISIFITRYMRRKIRVWKELHVVTQLIGFVSVFVGAGMMFYTKGDRIVTAHALFGLLTLLLTMFQAFRGFGMKTKKRDNYFASDRTHKWNGVFTLVMQFVTVYMGLHLLKPHAGYFYFYYAVLATFWPVCIYREYSKKRRLNRAVTQAHKQLANAS